jgi:hypothetical protein
MKHPVVLVVLMAMAVLFGVGTMMNSACKTSSHAWCDPSRQGVARSHEANNLIGHGSSGVRSSPQR